MYNRIANPEMLRAMNESLGLYTSRRRAAEFARGGDVIVHVEGGYRIMDAGEYNIWRKQR